jgi:hypothetical protein
MQAIKEALPSFFAIEIAKSAASIDDSEPSTATSIFENFVMTNVFFYPTIY